MTSAHYQNYSEFSFLKQYLLDNQLNVSSTRVLYFTGSKEYMQYSTSDVNFVFQAITAHGSGNGFCCWCLHHCWIVAVKSRCKLFIVYLKQVGKLILIDNLFN